MGRPGQIPTWQEQVGAFAGAGVRRQILAALPGDSTRGAVTGVRALVRRASLDCRGAPVGLVGLCPTGGFAIAAATEPHVAATVAGEPSVPLPPFGTFIDLSSVDGAILVERLAAGKLAARLYRFQGDKVSPCARLLRYGNVLPTGLMSRCYPTRLPIPPRARGLGAIRS